MDSSGKSLGRASIEAYAGIGIAIIAVVLPMTWYWKAILIVTLSALVVDLAFRSPVTSSWRKALKTGVSLAAVALIWAISWKPLLEQYGVDSTVNHPEPNVHPLWALRESANLLQFRSPEIAKELREAADQLERNGEQIKIAYDLLKRALPFIDEYDDYPDDPEGITLLEAEIIAFLKPPEAK